MHKAGANSQTTASWQFTGLTRTFLSPVPGDWALALAA